MKKLFTLIITLLSLTANAQKMAVNTDLLMDLAMSPNIGVEITTGNKTTLGLNILGNSKPWGQDMKLIEALPEFRYYFSGRPMYSFFVGLGASVGFYDYTRKGKVYDGMHYGGGLTFGYVHKLGKRLNLDAHAGFGIIGYKRKEYYVGDNYDADYTTDGELRTNATGYYLMPTRFGVSLTYILW